jgi:hypothetical protein
MFRPILPVAVVLSVTAAPASAQTYYEDVRPVLVESCMGCHSDQGVAWSMEDAEATLDRVRRIARAIDQRRMPPFLAERGHQQYEGDVTLDDATVDMVRRWAAAGYPTGDARPDPAPPASMGSHHAGFTPDVTLPVLPDQGYLPNQASDDDYRCFLVDWTDDAESYVTGFSADPGNRRVGHHVVVYAVDPEVWPSFRELEDIEEGPGYTCFGGALPDDLVRDRDAINAYEAQHPDGIQKLFDGNRWLAHWAPGMDGHVFPEGTGLRLAPGSGLVVQMHYYGGAAPGERDSGTSMGFITASEVDRPAMHLPQTDNDWFNAPENAELVIEPGEIRTFEYRDDLEDVVGFVARTAGVPEDEVTAIEIHSANLHMHAQGHSGEITLTHHTGEHEVLLSVPRWDLGWQRDFTFVEPKVLTMDELEGASLTVRCTFENTTEETVYGGLGSGDEMCFNFSYISVRTDEGVAAAGAEAR